MRQSTLIMMIMLLTLLGCFKAPKGQVGAVFSPGYTDGSLLNTRIYDAVKEVSRTYKVSSSDYAFLNNCLVKNQEGARLKVISPYLYIKLDGLLYVLGANCVVLTDYGTFSISQNDEYRIKCMFHYYDYQDDCFLLEMEEVRRFGVPAKRHFIAPDPDKPTKPFVKVILQEQ